MESIFPPQQLSLFDARKPPKLSSRKDNTSLSGSFVNNMTLPVHRWFRYSAGFSAEWVRNLLRDKKASGKDLFVLDPFAGVGTTLLACDAEGVKSIGFETHPFVSRITKIKLDSINVNPQSLKSYLDSFYFDVANIKSTLDSDQPSLLLKCYNKGSLATLNTFKNVYLADYEDDSPESRLLWLTITAILRTSSSAGTAQWQYVLPNKKKSKVVDPLEAFKAKAIEIANDIIHVQQNGWQPLSTLLQTDSRQPEISEESFIDLVITSPPYPNNYDYADATRLEMTFWGEIESWKDLQSSVRHYLIRSCSQHAAAEKLQLESLLETQLLDPIHADLMEACHKLADVRLKRGGRKNYHTMAAAYFLDMAQVFHSLRKLCRNGSELCFVIGDSAPYGVYLNVDEWLGQLALAAGFNSYQFEKIRDRNVKWKNRKHRVPLKEGRLWIRG